MTWLAAHRAWLLGLAVSIAFWPGMLSPAFGPRWAVLAIGLPLALAIDPRELPETIRWLLAFFLAIAAASIFVSPDRLTAYYEMMQIVIVAGVSVAAAGLDDSDKAMDGVAVGLMVSVMIALFGLSTAGDQGRGGDVIPTGLFLNSEVFAEFAALVFVWAAARMRPIAAAAALVPIALCNSRIAIATALIGVLYAYWPKSIAKGVALAACIGMVMVVMVFALGSYKIGTADHRIVIWGTAVLAFWHDPFGRGLGWFQAALPDEMFAHSDALQMLTELGVGAVAIIIIPIAALRKGRGTNAERALFVAVCFQSVVSFPLHMPASAFVAALVAGRLVGRRALVRVGEHVSRDVDDADQRRQAASDREYPVRSGRGGGAVSVRSGAENTAAVYPRSHRVDPEPRGA